MKTLTTNLMIAAAALAVAAGTASAQTMKAEVPFAFRAGRTPMPSGTYTISMDTSRGTVSLLNSDGSARALVLATSRVDFTKMSDAKLVFSCVAGNCSLVEAWSGEPGLNYSVPRPKVSPANAALLEIRLHK